MLRTAQYKLARGPHAPDNPGEEVCLVEAAIIAAGFERRRVNFVNDCPPCFCRAVARYALQLNDEMPDNLRNELLLPFVTRLAGTAAAAYIEAARERFIEEQSESLAQSNQSDPRTLWTMAALILDQAIMIGTVSKVSVAPARSGPQQASRINYKTSYLIAGNGAVTPIGHSVGNDNVKARHPRITSMEHTARALETPAEHSQPDRELEFS